MGCVLRFEKDKNTEFSHTLVKAFDFYKINGMEQNVTWLYRRMFGMGTGQDRRDQYFHASGGQQAQASILSQASLRTSPRYYKN